MTAPNQPAYGIHTSADVLVNRTADGVDLAELWTELIDLFAIENQDTTALVNLISYWHTEVASAVPQTIEGTDFEESTDLGVPKSAGPPSGAALLGFRLRDYDGLRGLAGVFYAMPTPNKFALSWNPSFMPTANLSPG